MVDENVMLYSEKMKHEAADILENTKLLEILSEFGIPHIIGSYATDLMYHPDIDIVVEANDLHSSSTAALTKLINKGDFEKIEYGDFVKFPRADRPNGYILVLRTTKKDVRWEIEVWFLSDAIKEENDVFRIRSLLTPELKRIVLEFKRQIYERSISKHKISSSDIYRAVLENGITDFEIFIRR